jgi:hypothetical protein
MNCMDWEERIALHAGGDLEEADAQAVLQHLRDCAACQVFWSGLRDTLAGLRESRLEDVPAAHFAAVRAGVIAEIERGRRVWRRLAWVSGVGIAAMLLVGLALKPSPLPPPPPRIAAAIPPAPPPPPLAPRSQPVVVPVRPRPRSQPPILVKLQTADPNIVIYWIADY